MHDRSTGGMHENLHGEYSVDVTAYVSRFLQCQAVARVTLEGVPEREGFYLAHITAETHHSNSFACGGKRSAALQGVALHLRSQGSQLIAVAEADIPGKGRKTMSVDGTCDVTAEQHLQVKGSVKGFEVHMLFRRDHATHPVNTARPASPSTNLD